MRSARLALVLCAACGRVAFEPLDAEVAGNVDGSRTVDARLVGCDPSVADNIACYAFDPIETDGSAYANHGTVGAGVTAVPGVIGQAALFTPPSSFMVGDAAVL